MNSIENFGGASVFNARDLKASDVAGGFIAPAAFSMLLGDSHCVLEGPRGSGKTTLLRMLTPDSYASWAQQNEAPGIGFIGIFVPADVRWAKQLETRLSGLDPAVAKYFMESAFSVATSMAIIETLECCNRNFDKHGKQFPEVFFVVDREQEARIARSLSNLWEIENGVPSFSGVKAALRVRQQKIGVLSALVQGGRPWLDILQDNNFLGTAWLDNAVNGLKEVNQAVDRYEQRWAILLDELEIVPPQILERVVQALRSTDPAIRFKLAISPTGTDLMFSGDNSAPSPENDYRAIPLWYEKRVDAREFSEKLFSRALFDGKGDSLALRRFLGGSRLSSDDEDSVDNSDVAKRARIESFVSLYNKDESFKEELDKRGIDPGNPPLSDASKVGTYVRKITPLVILRDRELSHFKDGASKRRGGRKSGDAYFGYPNLLDLAEGNPRWILTLADLIKVNMSMVLAKSASQGVQSSVLADYTGQFVSKLTVYPTGSNSSTHMWTLMKFVDMLGDELGNTLYRKEFSGDPALSFTIDEKSLNQYGNYIRLCIDLGALVIVRSGSAAPLGEARGSSSLSGARVRISYRLAYRYQLPLRSTKERSLSGAIRGGELLQEGQASGAPAKIFSGTSRVSSAAEDLESNSNLVPRQGRLL